MTERKLELNIDLDHAKKIEMLAEYVCKSVQEMKVELENANIQLIFSQTTINNLTDENETLKRKLKKLEELCQISNLKDIDIVD